MWLADTTRECVPVARNPSLSGHQRGLASMVRQRPSPLVGGSEDPGLGEEDFQRAQGALRRYVELIGFEQYPPSDLWCLTTAHIIPSLDDIVEGKLRVASDHSKRERPRRRAHHRHGTARERA